MARYVIKLGSSIVAEDSGELRADVIEGISPRRPRATRPATTSCS